MTADLPPFLERIQSETRAAREKVAGELLTLDAVRGAVAAAAARGLVVAVMRPPHPVDLRETDAARAAVKHLTDSGFKVEWESYREDEDGRPTDGVELKIFWVW